MGLRIDSSPEEYLYYLKSGLPRAKRKLHVAIVGAGMAGLVAGWLLKEAGCEVLIFEASNRVGGRIKTLREPFTMNQYAEAGAMRIPQNHLLTHWLIDDLGLKSYPWIKSNGNAIVYINGRRCRYSEYERNGYDFGLGLHPSETMKSGESLFNQAIAQIGDIQNNWQKWDRYSIRQFLREEAKLSEAAIELIGIESGHETNLSISLLESIRDARDIAPGSQYHAIEGGMDLLPKGFLSESLGRPSRNLSRELRFMSRVIAVSQYWDKLRVTWEHPITRDPRSLPFDHVIFTTPFSALRHIRIDAHLLSDKKARAIRQLHYDNSAKIILEFSKRFWSYAPREIIGGHSFTDLPIRWVYYPQHPEISGDHTHGILLASYTWGADSLRWTGLSHDDRIRFALRDLAILHDIPEDRLRELLVGGTSHSWADDEFTLGAFALFEPLQQTDFLETLPQREHNIHFAGEHTTLKHAWIEGAVESGIRAALELVDS